MCAVLGFDWLEAVQLGLQCVGGRRTHSRGRRFWAIFAWRVLSSTQFRRAATATSLLFMQWFYSLQSFKRHDRYVRACVRRGCGEPASSGFCFSILAAASDRVTALLGCVAQMVAGAALIVGGKVEECPRKMKVIIESMNAVMGTPKLEVDTPVSVLFLLPLRTRS